jgi:hypothetical protein
MPVILMCISSRKKIRFFTAVGQNFNKILRIDQCVFDRLQGKMTNTENILKVLITVPLTKAA